MDFSLKDVKQLKLQFEADGRQALGIRLTAAQAEALRRELHHLYGKDPGPRLTTLYGLEVLSVDAPELGFE